MLLSLSKRVLNACWHRRDPEGCVHPPQEPASRRRGRKTHDYRLLQNAVADCFGLSDIGRVRRSNEDQFLIADASGAAAADSAEEARRADQASVLLVADGVGGTAGGERASLIAAQCVARHLSDLTIAPAGGECGDEQVLAGLETALACAQRRISQEAHLWPRLVRMGTTLTLAYIAWPAAYVAHIGDSRAYLYRSGTLAQLTQDQTIAQMLADVGAIDPDSVPRHPYHNVLGSVLSADRRQFLPSTQKVALAPGDQLLLCTDGLTKYLDGCQIAEVLGAAETAEAACRQLIDAANEAGGGDNITVVVARFGAGTKGATSVASEVAGVR